MFWTELGRAVPKSKKETTWVIGSKGPIPPFPFKVWTSKKNFKIVYGFDEQHIKDMMEPTKIIKIKRIKEVKEKLPQHDRLGPKGSEISRPAEYEKAFHILKNWVDEQGGPPESVRKKILEVWVDYQKVNRE